MLPEHSAAAYTTAFYDGADFIEPDIQVTKNGILLVMHNPCMKETTNIESIPEFNNRGVNITYVGKQASFNWTNDYLVNDFTWEELVNSGVKLRNRVPTRNPHLNDLFPLMRLEDTIELMLMLNFEVPKSDKKFKTGLYIETKFVQFYKEIKNFDIASILYDVLKKYDIETVEKALNKLPIIIQSFEEESLLFFKNTTDLPRIKLLPHQFDYNLNLISQYAHGVGPNHKFLFNYQDERFNLDEPSLFIQECHKLGLLVHPWTLQDDKLRYTSNSVDEVKVYVQKGIDGIFTEFPQSTYQSILHFTGSRTILSELSKL